MKKHPITYLSHSDGIYGGIEMNEDEQKDGNAYHRNHHHVFSWWYVLEGRRTKATSLIRK